MKRIEHKGLITSIDGNFIDVDMNVDGACGACKAKSACGMGETNQRRVTVVSELPELFEIGEQVNVEISGAMGLKAVVLAYVVPFVFLLGGLIVFIECGLAEATAGLISLGIVMVYYVALYALRSRIDREIIFKIRKI